jgi:hypothetical protein
MIFFAGLHLPRCTEGDGIYTTGAAWDANTRSYPFKVPPLEFLEPGFDLVWRRIHGRSYRII